MIIDHLFSFLMQANQIKTSFLKELAREKESKKLLEGLLATAEKERDEARANLEAQARTLRAPEGAELAMALAERDVAREGQAKAQEQREATIRDQREARAKLKATVDLLLAATLSRDAAVAKGEKMV